ncbi:glycine cleavage system protein T [Luteitalea sp. TBR-22]|uniref:CAF17-like 4Fe-4S cluster assembly/insertion protein YgfZ n=1 Tax=Luteitalea sp. TBR-22 TaxID=2802971 RepID=UPI001AFB062F|nr:glycine cleavage T C-terminal barrel domain-containing protein [Luteitalea sp. TBR-22]BCS35781.1 glycine cleavage system protein T [Luteitalea sp. TBR-22]
MASTFDDEYRALHGDAIWTDRSTRDARLEVRGPDAATWLQGLLTQDVASLQAGQGAYAAYLTPQGRMIADLRVFHRGEAFVLECASTVRASLLSRLDQFVIMEDVTVVDLTEALGCLTVVGPTSAASASACTGIALSTLNGLPEHASLPLAVPGAFVAASREFGVPAFDLYAPRQDLAIWRTLLQARVPQAGERTLETARIEAGRPRFGVDMDGDTIPLEAGIESRAISFDKGCYVGQEVVIRILHRGQGRVARRLVWVEHAPHAQDSSGWHPGEAVYLGQKAVGNVSSVCWSPARGGLLGIAMVHRDAFEPGTTVRIGAHEAVVRALP